MLKKFYVAALVCFLSLSIVLTACSSGQNNNGAPSGTGAAPSKGDKPYAGQTIKFLVPTWFQYKPEFFKPFTDKTGITVEQEIMDWQQIHDNFVTASAANSPLADVIELDWSWVGQFGSAGWFETLNQVIPQDVQQDMGTLNIFKLKNDLVGVPASNDFRVYGIRKDRVGDKPVDTFDNLMKTAKEMKQSGVDEYPVSMTLAATEDLSTAYYGLVTAMGGRLFDDQWNLSVLDKNSPAYQALSYLFQLYNDGLIDPKALGLKSDEVGNTFRSGKGSIIIGYSPQGQKDSDDASKSKIVDKAVPILVPGTNGEHVSFGLPEGLGIPKNAEHKEAGIEFLKWLMQKDTMETLYNDYGVFPVRNSVVSDLFNQKKLKYGDIYAKQLQTMASLFPQGTPLWYSQFSTSVGTILNYGLKNKLSVDQTVQMLKKDFDKIDKSQK